MTGVSPHLCPSLQGPSLSSMPWCVWCPKKLRAFPFMTGCAIAWCEAVVSLHHSLLPSILLPAWSGGCLGDSPLPLGGTACGSWGAQPRALEAGVPTPVFAVVLLQPELSPPGE